MTRRERGEETDRRGMHVFMHGSTIATTQNLHTQTHARTTQQDGHRYSQSRLLHRQRSHHRQRIDGLLETHGHHDIEQLGAHQTRHGHHHTQTQIRGICTTEDMTRTRLPSGCVNYISNGRLMRGDWRARRRKDILPPAYRWATGNAPCT
jgi:hypothetical protein